MSVQIIHPYVTEVEGVAGGKPVIRGTRTPVRSIVAYHRMGNAAEEIQVKVPHLSLAQIYDALSFYYDHQVESLLSRICGWLAARVGCRGHDRGRLRWRGRCGNHRLFGW